MDKGVKRSEEGIVLVRYWKIFKRNVVIRKVSEDRVPLERTGMTVRITRKSIYWVSQKKIPYMVKFA